MRGGSFGAFPFFIVMEQEIWKPVKGWEKYYEVSNKARVRTLPREIITKDGRRRKVNARIKSVYVGKRGYYCVNLQANGKHKVSYLHRIMMDAFVENTKNKPCIDHIDGNKLNCSLDNMRYATQQENITNPNTAWKAWRPEIREQNINKILAKRIEKGQKFAPMTVYAYYPDGRFYRSFYSMGEAGRFVGRDPKIIQLALENNHRIVEGYVWSKKKRKSFPYVYRKSKIYKSVQEINEEGEVINEWGSARVLANEINAINYQSLTKFIRAQKPYYGRKFRYKDSPL